MATWRRVLIVEDDRKSLRALQEALQRAGHEVHGFENAIDAGRADIAVFDAAVIDMRLPDMPGVELGKMLKGKNPALNVIFVSGYRLENILGAVPGATFLQKPVSVEVLLNLL